MRKPDGPPMFFGCGITGHPQHHAHTHEGGWRDCDECQRALTDNLIGACASVGIEHGESTTSTLDQYMEGKHAAHAVVEQPDPRTVPNHRERRPT